MIRADTARNRTESKCALLLVSALLFAIPVYCASQVPAGREAATPADLRSSPVAGSAPATPHNRVAAHRKFIQAMATFISTQDPIRAERDFGEVTRVDPSYAPAWFNLGVLAERNGNWALAKRCFKEYLRIAPEGPESARTRNQLDIVTQYAVGKIDRAAAERLEYAAAIQRARAFLSASFFREAISEAGRAQALDDSRWEAYAIVSLCMARQQQPDAAATFRALALDRATAVEKRAGLFDALSQTADVQTH